MMGLLRLQPDSRSLGHYFLLADHSSVTNLMFPQDHDSGNPVRLARTGTFASIRGGTEPLAFLVTQLCLAKKVCS